MAIPHNITHTPRAPLIPPQPCLARHAHTDSPTATHMPILRSHTVFSLLALTPALISPLSHSALTLILHRPHITPTLALATAGSVLTLIHHGCSQRLQKL